MFGGVDDVHEFGRYGLSPRTERLAADNLPHCIENAQHGRHIDKVGATKRFHRILIEDALAWTTSEEEYSVARNFLDVSQNADGLRRLASSLIDAHINYQKKVWMEHADEGEVEHLQQLDDRGYRKSVIAYKDPSLGNWVALFPENAEVWELELALDQYRKVAARADRRGDHVESVIALWRASGDESGTLGDAIDRVVTNAQV